MMRTQNGVTLFECLIYLTLFAFIAVASSSTLIRLWRSSLHASSIERSHLSLYSAFDALTHELSTAPCDRAQWKYFSPTLIIWQTEKKDLSWHLKKDTLYRVEGSYDTQHDTWKKKQSASIAHHLTHLSFEWIKSNGISQVRVTLSDGITTIKEPIILHNRILDAKS